MQTPYYPIMERATHAKELFLTGNNCAQSVILSFADDMKYSRELAQRLAAGFGGGMGKQQGTCGAVTGAIMVLGMKRGEMVNNNDELMEKTYESVQRLIRSFVDDFGTTSCRELTGCDFQTPEGTGDFKEKKVKERICAPCVERAVRIVESL